MLYYTYVLLDKNLNFYIGYSQDLKKRISEHQNRQVFATKSKLPIKLIYYEASKNKYDSLAREKYLKSGPGRKFLKNRLKQFLKRDASI
jgi:putative endonuclease